MPGGATSTTDAFGNYSFTDLCAGTYSLQITNNNKLTLLLASDGNNEVIVIDTIAEKVSENTGKARSIDFSYKPDNYSGNTKLGRTIHLGLNEGDSFLGKFEVIQIKPFKIKLEAPLTYNDGSNLWKYYYNQNKLFIYFALFLFLIASTIWIALIVSKLKDQFR